MYQALLSPHKREPRFQATFMSDPSTAYESLKEAIRPEFGETYWNPDKNIFCRSLKSGVDLFPGTIIPDRSIIRAIIDRKEVGTTAYKHE